MGSIWPAGGLFVCLLLTPLAAPAGVPKVSVDISALDESPATALPLSRLRSLLLERLREDGFVVVPIEGEHDVVLSLAFRNPGWSIRAALPAETLAREVIDCGVLRPEDRLEIVQKATELVRRAHLRAASAASSTESQPPAAVAARPPVPAIAVSLPTAPGPTIIEGSMGIDLLIRGDHADPMAQAGGRLGLGPHLGLHLVTGISDSGDGQISVVEWQTLLGLGYRVRAKDWLSVEAAAEGGLLLHHYAIPLLDSGNRVDPLAMVVLIGNARFSRHVGLDLQVGSGLSRTEYAQAVGDWVIWSRSRFRVEAGLGLVFH